MSADCHLAGMSEAAMLAMRLWSLVTCRLNRLQFYSDWQYTQTISANVGKSGSSSCTDYYGPTDCLEYAEQGYAVCLFSLPLHQPIEQPNRLPSIERIDFRQAPADCRTKSSSIQANGWAIEQLPRIIWNVEVSHLDNHFCTTDSCRPYCHTSFFLCFVSWLLTTNRLSLLPIRPRSKFNLWSQTLRWQYILIC